MGAFTDLSGQRFGEGRVMLEFFPRAQLVSRLKEGWRLISNHAYSRDEYAILMQFPDDPKPASDAAIKAVLRRFQKPKQEVRSNLSRSASSRQYAQWAKARRRLEDVAVGKAVEA